jgi:hypothetical protein
MAGKTFSGWSRWCRDEVENMWTIIDGDELLGAGSRKILGFLIEVLKAGNGSWLVEAKGGSDLAEA